jgi:hypothetical protein
VSAVRMSAEASIRRIKSLPGVGRKIPTHRSTRTISLGADAAADRPPMLPRHSASVLLPPRGPPVAPLPRRGESMQQPRRDRYDSPQRGYGGSLPRRPQADHWAGQAAPPVMGLGLEAFQGMTNAMNVISNQVIRNLGRSGRNPGWPYFDGTFRDYLAFKRKFESFQMTYHRGTPTQELFQQFREMLWGLRILYITMPMWYNSYKVN